MNYILSICAIIFLVIVIFLFKQSTNLEEHFDASGLVYNQPSEWFAKKRYDPNDWLVAVYPDMQQPECLPYAIESKYGSLEDLNYYSQAYRFWRF